MAGTDQTPLSLGAVPYDNSGLRDRLGDYVPQHRSIEAELRAAMAERESATPAPTSNGRWR
jgi:hypothetical protein